MLIILMVYIIINITIIFKRCFVKNKKILHFIRKLVNKQKIKETTFAIKLYLQKKSNYSKSKVINIWRNDTKNIGDLVCAPSLYFE